MKTKPIFIQKGYGQNENEKEVQERKINHSTIMYKHRIQDAESLMQPLRHNIEIKCILMH